MFKQLWLIVEGPDDERFCKQIVAPFFANQYDHINCWSYAGKTNKQKQSFLRSVNSVSSWDYILFGDINHSPCITAKKNDILEQFEPNLNNNDKVIIVVQEIEGWYLSGIDSRTEKELGLKSIVNTNNITKEEFNQIIPTKFDRVDFMVELLERFKIKTAKQKNHSFEYFAKKFGL